MEIWVWLVIAYSLINGLFETSKKKALKSSSVFEVLVGFTTLAFIFAALTTKDAFEINISYIPIIVFKSAIVIIAWLLNTYVLDKMSLSVYGILKISTIIFSTTMGCIFFGEVLTLKVLIGMIIVLTGLILVNLISEKNADKTASIKLVVLMLISCFCSSFSAIIDKAMLSRITSSQIQFWFLLFSGIGYWIIIFIKRIKIKAVFNSIRTNPWIILTAFLLAFGDRLLFIANSYPESKVSVMTFIKQLHVIETIILGKFIFGEKNIIKKLLCSLLIILGLVLILI